MSERDGFIKDLRAFADWLESNPDVPTPVFPQRFDVFCLNKEQMVATCRAVGGKMKKGVTESFFYLRKDFRTIHYEVNALRDNICDKVVIGTRTIPAEPERTVTIAAQPERTEEITEWRCSEVLK